MKTINRRIPFFLSTEDAGQLADLLYRHMTVANAFSESPSAKATEAAHLLSQLRRQLCLRSGMDDPFAELPLAPVGKRPREGGIICRDVATGRQFFALPTTPTTERKVSGADLSPIRQR